LRVESQYRPDVQVLRFSLGAAETAARRAKPEKILSVRILKG